METNEQSKQLPEGDSETNSTGRAPQKPGNSTGLLVKSDEIPNVQDPTHSGNITGTAKTQARQSQPSRLGDAPSPMNASKVSQAGRMTTPRSGPPTPPALSASPSNPSSVAKAQSPGQGQPRQVYSATHPEQPPNSGVRAQLKQDTQPNATKNYNEEQTGQQKLSAYATGLNLTKRASQISSLDEMYYFLVNDTRTVIEFDRSFLLVHLGGVSKFATTNNQPIVEKKSAYLEEWNKLAIAIANHSKVIFLSNKVLQGEPSGLELSKELEEALKRYLAFSSSVYLFCIPMCEQNHCIGHLMFEFVDAPVPNKTALETMITIFPALTSSFLKLWIKKENPNVWRSVAENAKSTISFWDKFSRKFVAIVATALLITSLMFLMPVPFFVGGEAEVVPEQSRMAFANADGMILDVSVKEGDVVKQGDRLGLIDSAELDYRGTKSKMDAEIQTREIERLTGEASIDQTAWAKKRVAELKRQAALEEVAYVEWKKRFLTITSPLKGVVVTKNIESLKGKMMKTGESFCDIAVPSEFVVEALIPEERIGYVKPGQPMTFYLNSDPNTEYRLWVREIAPMSRVVPRMGNVFPVRAPLMSSSSQTRLGMKGMARIDVESANLWFIITQRLMTRVNQFLLAL